MGGIDDWQDISELRKFITHTSGPAEYFFREGCFISELCNSPDTPERSVARVRVEPGQTTRWHRLTATVERYLMVAGTGLVEVGDAPPRRVIHGDGVVIPAGVAQRITNIGEDDLIFLAICTPRFVVGAYEELQ
jgi:quercetin dioxygenase-like cupin family protein